MLENKVIVYDDSCPMCKLYTYWFVAWGFLKPENRIGFATAPAEITNRLDLNRGRHEIPLFDRATHDTIYGLKALTFVLGSRWTWLKPILDSKWLFYLLYPLYQVITYNRRVIAGCKACSGFDCAPDLNQFYRGLYLLLAASFVGWITWMMFAAGTEATAIGFGLSIAFAVVGLVRGMIIRLANGSRAAWDFFGSYLTVMIIVAAMLFPILVWPEVPSEIPWIVIGSAVLMGLAELRRRDY